MYRLLLITLLTLCSTGQVQSLPPEKPPIPQVDVAEVLRRGDMVVVAGEGPRGASEDAMRMATAPPPDESHMWFVTVIKTNNCPYCTKLHSDFQSAPELLAFVAATAPYKPWGHYNEYNVTDETQKWRLKAYRITGYPTIVIQPPRNGMWGNPRTVVFQTTGYDGNPKKLAQAITNGVRAYAAKMGEQGYPKIQAQEFLEGTPGVEAPKSPTASKTTGNWGSLEAVDSLVVVGGAKGTEEDILLHPLYPGSLMFNALHQGSRQFTPEQSAHPPVESIHEPAKGSGQYQPQYGVNPPFATPPKVDPFNPQPGIPQPVPLQPTPNWPPTTPTPDQQVPPNLQVPSLGTILSMIMNGLGGLFNSQGLGNLTLLILVGLKVLELVAPITPTKLDDQALAILLKLVPSKDGTPPPSPSVQVTLPSNANQP